MSESKLLRMVDWERVFLVPILFLLFLASAISLFSGADFATGGLIALLGLPHRVMLLAFYVLAVLLLLIRSDATAKSDRILPRVAAYAGTFAPFLLAFAGGEPVSLGQSMAAVSLQSVGLIFSIYSLAVLRRSFGVEPQVRTLVRTGPYRFIRHPLYVGEIASLAGAVWVAPSWEKLAILVLAAALQAYRAVQEERLLAAHLPEFRSYMRETRMFVPGLI